MTIGRELSANLSVLLGVNNRRPDFRLRTKDGVFVRSAVNADITDANSVSRRDGFTEVVAGTRCRAAWADLHSTAGFFVDGSTLYRADPAGAGLALTALAADVAASAVSFTRMGDEVVFTDGVRNRAIELATNVVRPLGATGLAAAPVATAAAGGSLDAGYYSVAFAFMNASREISPLTPPAQVLVSAFGAIAITGIPAWPADAAELLVYAAPLNSEVLMLQARFASPLSSLTIPVLSNAGQAAATQHMMALPPGLIIRWHAGRLFVAAGPVLWYSNPYSPALCTPTQGFAEFLAPITVVEPCDDGVYVVADATYWLAGDITQAVAKVVAPTRGVLGTGLKLGNSKRACWMSEQGMVVGAPGGAVELPQAENVAVAKAAAGAGLYRESDGQRHLLMALSGAHGSTAARSYMDAEVIRKGTAT